MTHVVLNLVFSVVWLLSSRGRKGWGNQEEVTQYTALETKLDMSAVWLASEKRAIVPLDEHDSTNSIDYGSTSPDDVY